MNEAKPLYLIAGGFGRGIQDVLKQMGQGLAQAGRQAPSVAYLGVASDDDRAFFASIKAMLVKAGAGTVVMPRLATLHPDVDKARETIAAADVVFISGGEVEDGISWLDKAGLRDFLRQQYEAGKPFMGLSAGTIMMGRHWVHWDIPDDNGTASLFDCLGFAPYTFDTHAESEDWVELRTAVRLMGDGSVGYGIRSNTMVVVDRDGRMTADKPPVACVNQAGRITYLPD